MRTAFLIVSSDEAPLLGHSLPAALAEGFTEGLVVDNASGDGTAGLADRHGVPRLRLEHRVPYTEAMNAGLRRLTGVDAVALLQADTFVQPGYLRSTSAVLESDARVGVVAPKLIRATSPTEALDAIDAAGMTLDRRRKNGLAGHGLPATCHHTPGRVFGADGAAALYRTTTLRDAAPDGEVFDENMPGWGCDADLSWRVRLLGWEAQYEPAAVVHHIRTYSPSTRSFMSGRDRRTQFRNRLLMIAKNDGLADLIRDAPYLAGYEILALGYAILREPVLLGGYVEALGRLPGALRRRRQIQRRRRSGRVPFGLLPPA